MAARGKDQVAEAIGVLVSDGVHVRLRLVQIRSSIGMVTAVERETGWFHCCMRLKVTRLVQSVSASPGVDNWVDVAVMTGVSRVHKLPLESRI